MKDPRLRERVGYCVLACMYIATFMPSPFLQGFGEAEGCPFTELVQAAKHHQVPVNEYTPPGGETLQQLYTRIEDFWATLCRSAIAYCMSATYQLVLRSSWYVGLMVIFLYIQ